MTDARICRVCNERPIRPAGGTRCQRCIDYALRRTCSGCGVLVTRRAKRCKSCNTSGPFNSAWTGGRFVDGKGYVQIRSQTKLGPHPTAFDHPRRNARGYVFEHILVMEETLGRRLFAGENVHHRNGVRDDNRPENLELWVVKQPPGQRPEDLVVWAREILERYS